ncbi:hypothetical protein ZIOFF_056241 [Zingiber officinale]|uniref:RanBP2-type domain-containing protein n=1 Tax=Zingiber officinale TaxID=94328 RepID=A0A8J5FHS1_ZINOF|nr:hypothetical protein ZIOFF_056241 [Zingiber officinale]
MHAESLGLSSSFSLLMAFSPASLLLRRSSVAASLSHLTSLYVTPFFAFARSLSAASLPHSSDSSAHLGPPIPSLSDRLAFILDQIDAVGRDRGDEDSALQRIREWHQTKAPIPAPSPPPSPPPDDDGISLIPAPREANQDEIFCVPTDTSTNMSTGDVLRRQEVELVHPWPEWIELMERLLQQNYFNFRRTDEELVVANSSIDPPSIKEEMEFDFLMDWTTVRDSCINFGRDRFDILRSLSRKDIQVLVGHGCPSLDSKVVFSAKLLRKLVHLDEGDVCSSCNLRNSCGKGYILTRKEDEACTLDVMRILLTFGFDHVKQTVENKPLMEMKSVKIVARKLLHEIVKLSAIPIDPNLTPPEIKKPPPKVKQPPPPPKKRVGRSDVEMKKGDWLCTECSFMNFSKNTVCLQCDAKRPKRQLLPGEWECPQRNMTCFHCEHNRPPHEYTESQVHTRETRGYGPRTRKDSASNLDFDDNESDGADVAEFELPNPCENDQGSLDNQPYRRTDVESKDDMVHNGRVSRTIERDHYFKEDNQRISTLRSHGTGFDDFDDEEDDDVDSFELEKTQASEVSWVDFSELENTSEGPEKFDQYINSKNQAAKDTISDTEDEDIAEHSYRRSSYFTDSGRLGGGRGHRQCSREMTFVSDDGFDSDSNEMDESLRSRHGKGQQGRAREQNFSNSGDRYRFGMESDDNDLSRGSKRGKASSRGSQREFGVNDRTGRRSSYGRGNHGSRGSHMHQSGTGASYRSFRDDNEFRRFDRQNNKEGFGASDQRRNQFTNGTRGLRRNGRGWDRE